MIAHLKQRHLRGEGDRVALLICKNLVVHRFHQRAKRFHRELRIQAAHQPVVAAAGGALHALC